MDIGSTGWHAARLRTIQNELLKIQDELADTRTRLTTDTAQRDPQSSLQREALMDVAQAVSDVHWATGTVARAVAMLEELAELERGRAA